ncbi:MAG: copper chaperone PCu(A)C [Sphingomonadales bacterium]
MMKPALAALLLGAPLLAMPAWAAPQVAQPQVTGAVIRITYPGARTAAAYLTISNPGPAADVLESVSIPAAARSDLHGTVQAGGMMQMRSLAGIPVPAGGRITLAPGGQHVMLIGIKAPLAIGTSVPGTLHFAKSPSVKLLFKVEAIQSQP